MRKPGPTTAFVMAAVALAVIVFCIWWSVAPAHDWTAFLVLAALCVAGAQARVRRLGAGADLSVISIVQLTAILLIGPAGAMAVGAGAWFLEVGHDRLPIRVRAFNMAVATLIAAGASAAYLLVGGELRLATLSTPGALVLHAALPLIVANIVMCLLNAALLAAVVSIDNGLPYREILADILRAGGLAYVGYGVFGLLLAVVWGPAQVGPMAAVLVLAPLFIARWAFAQYADERAAHDRTVAALVQAVEAKDHYTRGHSERVATASVLIGRMIGLPSPRTDTLHFAGMLHDVGKVGVPTRMLRHGGALTDAEFAAIARHPVQGLELVHDIEFLGEAFDGILHHHERLDGRGYPMGLVGEAIPQFARIIAVADAFDSMTSVRSYRGAREVDEALDELRMCAGTQFDPQYVEALVQALDKTTWTPHRPPETDNDGPPDESGAPARGSGDPSHQTESAEAAFPVPQFDHDDPRVALAPTRSAGERQRS